MLSLKYYKKGENKMNKIIVIGNLVDDIKVFESQSGTSYARGRIAVRKNFGEGTNFIDFKAFGKRSEVLAQYTHKGSKVCLYGELEVRNVKTAGEYGADIWKTYADIVIDGFEFLDAKQKEQGETYQRPQEPQRAPEKEWKPNYDKIQTPKKQEAEKPTEPIGDSFRISDNEKPKQESTTELNHEFDLPDGWTEHKQNRPQPKEPKKTVEQVSKELSEQFAKGIDWDKIKL